MGERRSVRYGGREVVEGFEGEDQGSEGDPVQWETGSQ